ncbi:TPA: class I SAM-dependent methyltransferase [Candidatus Dojkabacteria bacterium]|uniref:Class I SAM-dependent methyltransferase n=1 Tax=Candidatus Dojkabacteria bacterium TaxID=2099670 RepID=A0A832QDC6_9BACT|nr:class I SAM-dependent methyltransferase [Candidatus Dojkabacteria bacterium]
MKKPQLSTLNHQYTQKANTLIPYEIYLKYSTQKDTSTIQLQKILSRFKNNQNRILDVGSGDGSYLLQSLPEENNFEITFLEPAKDLFKTLKTNIQQYSNCKAINETFEDFHAENKNKFDIILASHLYHFPEDEYSIFLSQLISLLEDSGTLIWIERGIDEVTDFKKRFKSMLVPSRYPEDWKPRSYNKALGILKEQSGNTELILNESELRFPYEENFDEVIALVEFYLNIDWISIPIDIQNEILEYIEDKGGVLKEEEGVIIFKKEL